MILGMKTKIEDGLAPVSLQSQLQKEGRLLNLSFNYIIIGILRMNIGKYYVYLNKFGLDVTTKAKYGK